MTEVFEEKPLPWPRSAKNVVERSSRLLTDLLGRLSLWMANMIMASQATTTTSSSGRNTVIWMDGALYYLD